MELKLAGKRAIITEVADRQVLFKALSGRHGNLSRSHENGQMDEYDPKIRNNGDRRSYRRIWSHEYGSLSESVQ